MTVQKLLAEIVDARESRRWLNAPNIALDGARPIRLIERGETNKVIEVLERVRQGLYV